MKVYLRRFGGDPAWGVYMHHVPLLHGRPYRSFVVNAWEFQFMLVLR